jgi:hypothetical protein
MNQFRSVILQYASNAAKRVACHYKERSLKFRIVASSALSRAPFSPPPDSIRPAAHSICRGSLIKNEPISKRYFAVRKQRRGKSRMPLQRALRNWFILYERPLYMQFVTKTSSLIDLHIMCKYKEIAITCNTKFLRLTLDNTFSWKNHIEAIVPGLSLACFAVRVVKPFLSQESLKMVYFSFFHSIMSYGLVFWGNFCHSNTVFKLQKRIIRIMVGIRDRDSCREYFRKLKILPL